VKKTTSLLNLEEKLTREQLEHAIRAACDVSGDTEIWIFGSQAILGQFPNAPESLRTSIEVDVQPKNNPVLFSTNSSRIISYSSVGLSDFGKRKNSVCI
jgi:hypothetical protein